MRRRRRKRWKIWPYALCFVREGNKWACVFGDFRNLAESPAGFGDTLEEARADLRANHLTELKSRKAS